MIALKFEVFYQLFFGGELLAFAAGGIAGQLGGFQLLIPQGFQFLALCGGLGKARPFQFGGKVYLLLVLDADFLQLAFGFG